MTKHSEIILNFAADVLLRMGPKRFTPTMDLVVAAWNAGLLPSSLTGQIRNGLVSATSKIGLKVEDTQALAVEFDRLVHQKRTRFAQHQWAVITWDGKVLDHRIVLSVGTTPLDPEKLANHMLRN